MTKEIKKVGIIGAGAMGGGIAAQLANAGVEVVLLDKTKENADKAVERMVNAVPKTMMDAGKDPFNELLMTRENARFITTGDSTNNMDLLADCDWIVESILAPNHVKTGIYQAIDKVAKPTTIYSSNTSTIQIEDLTEGLSEDLKSRFINAHFFNPVRWMHLLEIISNDDADPENVKALMDFGSRVLGKKTVHCKNARGFIANRIGIFAMERAKVEALSQHMKIEDVDAIMGTAFGFPHLGLFKLADEVGIDIIEHVRTDLNENLPAEDAFKRLYTGNEELTDMMDNGLFGNRKADSKGGYYRKKVDADDAFILNEKGKPRKESRDLATGEYRDFENSDYFRFDKQIKKYGGFAKFFESGDPAAKFAWPVIRDLMTYVLDHAEELSYNLQDVDSAMRAGFNWEFGPFELMDKFGVKWFTEKLEAEGRAVPDLLAKAKKKSFYRQENGQNQVMSFDGGYAPIKREDGVLSLDDVKASSKPLVTHNSASLWDIGDGIVALEFHAPKNVIDPSMFWVINESIKLVSANPDKYKGMVIYNDEKSFSFGANLKLVEIFMNASVKPVLRAMGLGGYIEKNMYKVVEEMVYQGQSVYNALNQAPFPVVGAPKGNQKNRAFGGACEILMHCDAIQSGPEQVIALPEPGLGLIPGWGGTTRYLERMFEKPGQMKGPMPAVIESMMTLPNPLVSGAHNAQDAKKKLWLSADDGISMNPDRVLADAKAKAIELAKDYAPKPMPTFNLPGLSGKSAIRMDVDRMYKMGGDPAKGAINHIDVKVADALADIFTGGERLNRADVDLHVDDAAVAAKLKQIMDERGEDSISIHAGITLNISRLLQLERDRFLDRFHDKATWARVKYTLSNGGPPREPRLVPAPTTQEIRDGAPMVELKRRNVTGQPLSGDDAVRLKAMADMASSFHALYEQKSMLSKIQQVPNTLCTARKVFRLL